MKLTVDIENSMNDFLPTLEPTIVKNNIINKNSLYVAQKITKNTVTRNLNDILVNFQGQLVQNHIWASHNNLKPKQFEGFALCVNNAKESPVNLYIDIGTGSGHSFDFMSTVLNATKAISFDVDDYRVEKSSEFHKLELNRPIDIIDETVDVVSMFHSLHHMDDASYRLRDISRMLKPGGFLLIKDHNVQNQTDAQTVTFEHFVYSIGEGKTSINNLFEYKNNSTSGYYYSEKHLTCVLNQLGFEKIFCIFFKTVTRVYKAVYRKKM